MKKEVGNETERKKAKEKRKKKGKKEREKKKEKREKETQEARNRNKAKTNRDKESSWYDWEMRNKVNERPYRESTMNRYVQINDTGAKDKTIDKALASAMLRW